MTIKKWMTICLALLFFCSLVACEGPVRESQVLEETELASEETAAPSESEESQESEAEASEEVETEAAEVEETEASEAPESEAEDPELTLTAEERAAETVLYFPVGAKFTLPEIFKQNVDVIRRANRGFEVGPRQFIASSREYFFRPTVAEGQEPFEDYAFPLFGVVIVDKERQPEDEKEFKEGLGYAEIEEIADFETTTQYYGVGIADESQIEKLSKDEQKLYRELLEAAQAMREEIYFFAPQLPEESIGSLKNLNFETVDLADHPVTGDIFKEHEVTLVSYMTTWCPHCIEELPQFAEAMNGFLKSEIDGGIVGIYADLVPEEEGSEQYDKVRAEAEKLLKEAEANFPVLQNSYDLQNKVTKYAMNYPTNFFVDRNGDVLSVHIGGFEDLQEAFASALKIARAEASVAEEEYELTDEELAKVLADPKLKLTETEKSQGYQVTMPIGAKFKVPEVYRGELSPWRRQIRAAADGDHEMIRMSREYYFYPSKEAEERYLKYPLFAFFVLNRDKLPESEEAISKELGFSELEKVYEDDHVVQYFARGKYDSDGLERTEREEYKKLYDAVDDIRKSVYAFRALGLEDTVGRAKKWDFKAKNFAGQEVDRKIFEKKPMTLVSFMATWCPHCVEELPLLEKSNELDDVQVIYIVADYSPEQLSKEELKEVEDAIAKLFPEKESHERIFAINEHLESTLTSNITAFPCNFMLDSQGNVIQVRLGSYEEESLTQDLQTARLKLAQAK